jgi:spore germination protein KA
MLKKFHKKKKSVIYSETPKNENMELTISNLRSILGKNSDVEFRDIFICGDQKYPAGLVFVSGLVDVKGIANDVIKPLMDNSLLCEKDSIKNIISLIQHGFVYSPTMKTYTSINDTINDILTGSCALVFDNENTALTFEIKGFEKRQISEPTNESSVKGPKDSFVESLRVNTATIRRKIATQNLTIEQTKVGRQSLTQIDIVYLNGTVNPNLVNEVKRRLESIEIDGVVEAGFVEEYIVDKKYTTFPLIGATERPDRFCISILEGRVGLVIDGLPVAYIIPATIQQFLRAADDYSQNFIVVSALRILRYFSMLLTIFLPAFYIAITTFHQEMIPTELAMAIAAAKEGVPYPSFIEIFDR